MFKSQACLHELLIIDSNVESVLARVPDRTEGGNMFKEGFTSVL